MARYIDADKLKEDLKESESRLREIYKGLTYDEDKQICAGQITTFVECILRVKDAPTLNVAIVKHGEWKECFEDWRKQIVGDECSACGFRHYGTSISNYNYCPNCGARMDGGKAE